MLSTFKSSFVRRAGAAGPASYARTFSTPPTRKTPEAGDLDAEAAEKDFGELKSGNNRPVDHADGKDTGSVKQPTEKSSDPADDGYGVASGGDPAK